MERVLSAPGQLDQSWNRPVEGRAQGTRSLGQAALRELGVLQSDLGLGARPILKGHGG